MDDRTHACWLADRRRLADLLRLRDWDIILERDDPHNASAWASNSLTYGQRRCVIRIARALFAESPEQHRRACVHELLHCHFDPLDDAMGSVIDRLENGKATDLARDIYTRQREHALDHIATAIAPLLPLPELIP